MVSASEWWVPGPSPSHTCDGTAPQSYQEIEHKAGEVSLRSPVHLFSVKLSPWRSDDLRPKLTNQAPPGNLGESALGVSQFREAWRKVLLLLLSHQVVSRSCKPMYCSPPGSSLNIIQFYNSKDKGPTSRGCPTRKAPDTDTKLLNLRDTGLFPLMEKAKCQII